MERRGLLEMLISRSEEHVYYRVLLVACACVYLSDVSVSVCVCVCARRVSLLVLETAPVAPFYS